MGERLDLPMSKPLKLFGFPWELRGKGSACNAGDMGSIPGSEKSPGEGNGYPFQDSGLENSTDKRSLAGYSPWVCRVRHDLATN